jgi:DNA-binding MarR family transcriptional regulator
MLPRSIRELYGSHIKVLMHAMREIESHGYCKLVRTQIAKATGLDRSGINRAIQGLELFGLIKVDKEGYIHVTAPFWIVISSTEEE